MRDLTIKSANETISGCRLKDTEWNEIDCLNNNNSHWVITDTILFGQCFSLQMPNRDQFRVSSKKNPFEFLKKAFYALARLCLD